MKQHRRNKVPNIVRGGTAIPIGDDLFLMKGRTHEQGGIDIGKNLEVETNEVMQVNPKSIKVFSSVPFLNGNSPAELVLNGANPNEVFDAQEEFKDRNNLNDDGSRKKRFGDEYTAPVDNTRVYNNILPINKHITDKKINFVPKELDLTDSPLGYFPIIGDVLQGIQSIVDVTNKNYKNALLNAGLLFIPNIIEKPIKGSIKTAGKYAIRHQISKEAALKQIRTGNPEAVAPSLALTTRDRTMGSAYAGNDGIYLIGNPDNIYNKEIEAFIGDGSSPRVKDIKQKYNIDYDIPNDELLEYFKKYRNEINLKNSNTLQEVYDSPIKGGFPYHEIKVYDNIPYSDFGYGIIPYSDDEIISYFKNANIPYELYDNRLYRNNYDFSNRIHNRIHDIITDNPNLAFKCGGRIKARNGIIKRIKNKISNIYWHTLRAPKDYTDDKAVLRNGKTTIECAKWANDALQDQGLSIFGDAWTRSSNKGLKKVYSGYDRKARPTEYDEAAVEQYVFNAADSLAKTMDLSKLQTNDIVGLYFRNSPNKETAYRKGTNGEAQTHTGNIVVEDGIPYVIHNVHGELIKNKAKDLIGSNHPYGIVSVYRKEFGGMKQYRNGGLSRNKDYGSSKKPYPSVKSSDFAGGNRSYPIPTEADVIDALRLAGLHGRSDVKVKVYKKYPELRKRKDLGGEEDLIKYGVGENPWLTGLGYDKPFGVKIVRFNNDKGNPEVAYKPRFKVNIPTTKLQVPTFDVDSLVTKALIETLPETLPGDNNERSTNGSANASSPSTGVGQKATTSPTARTVSINSGVPQRELDETYRQYSEAIRRNVPLPTRKAVALTDNAQVLFDNRIKQHIAQNVEKNRKERSKNGTDYTPVVLNGIGALGNIAGNIASSIINRRMIDELEYAPEPIPLLPTKLKTKININPQLQRLYTDLGLMTNTINSNTASSRTALARNQRLRNQIRQAANELYGNKENIETQLINRDRFNQQQVSLNNVQQYNRWRQGLADFNNELANLRAENKVATTQGIVGAINDFLSALEQNNLEARNLSYLQQSNPYAIDALSPDAMAALNAGNGYIRLGRCGGRFKSKNR